MEDFSFFHILMLLCIFLFGGGLVGYPLTYYFDSNGWNRVLLAPPLGLAVFGVVSLPVLMCIPFTRLSVGFLGIVVTGCCWGAGRWIRPLAEEGSQSLNWKWILAAGLISSIPAYAVAPHFYHSGVSLGAPIFDHAKVILINDMIINGIPPHNPFLRTAHTLDFLNYYYGWYFLAAEAALLSGNTGWVSDVVFTGVTAFFSLVLMGWGALRLSGRLAAAWVILLFSLISRLQPFFIFIFGVSTKHVMFDQHALETWLLQSAWVPQHLFSATIACFSIFLLVNLINKDVFNLFLSILVGVLIGFSYNSSVWVGLAALLPIVLVIVLLSIKNTKAYLLNLVSSGLVSFIVVMPFILQQFNRLKNGPTISIWVFPVFSHHMHNIGSIIINILGYWLYALVLYFGILYGLSLLKLKERLGKYRTWSLEEKAICVVCVVPLLSAEFLHSVISNNDLGWRCVLVSIMGMMVVSSCVFFEIKWTIKKKVILSVFFLPSLITGLSFITVVTFFHLRYEDRKSSPKFPLQFDSVNRFSNVFLQVGENGVISYPEVAGGAAKRFYQIDPKMWEVIDEVTPLHEAVANNPAYERSLTPWEGSISWALLSKRANCTPSQSYLEAFSVDLEKRHQVFFNALIRRVFNGMAQADDYRVLRDEYLCRTLLVVPGDVLWNSSQENLSLYFHLVKEKLGMWRIYRANIK